MRIIIDADGCPREVLTMSQRLAGCFGLGLWTVASHHHELNGTCHIMVGDAPEETDIKIVNMAQPGDIVITHDLGLAAMVLPKKVRCLSPSGGEYREISLTFRLEERALKARMRRSGTRTPGPSKRTRDDDRRFEAALRSLLEQSRSSDELRC